jgi:hypothetical protein
MRLHGPLKKSFTLLSTNLKNVVLQDVAKCGLVRTDVSEEQARKESIREREYREIGGGGGCGISMGQTSR